MLRAAAQDADNELGQKAAACMEAGELVPDDLIIGLVAERLGQEDCRKQGWLLDGFPRTAVQAQKMGEMFLVPNKAVLLDVPDEVLVERVTGRRNDPETGKIYHMKFSPPEGEDAEAIIARLEQRKDDTEEALRARLVNFAANRDAVAAEFANCSSNVDGNRDKTLVWEDIKAHLAA
jgi:adenylate kinase